MAFRASVNKIIEPWNASYVEGMNRSNAPNLGLTHPVTNRTLSLQMPVARLWGGVIAGGLLSSVVKYTDGFLPSLVVPGYFGPGTVGLSALQDSTYQNISTITDWIDDGPPVASMKKALAAMSSIRINPNAETTEEALVEAIECAISLCVRTYDVRVQEGNLQTKILATDNGQTGSIRYPTKGGMQDAVVWSAHVNKTKYMVMGGDLYTMSLAITSALTGTIVNSSFVVYDIVANGTGVSVKGLPIPSEESPSGSSPEITTIYAQKNFSRTIENVAASLNNHLQRYATNRVLGKVLVQETFVHVRWPWLVLPLVLVLAGTAALLAVICQTRKEKAVLWKCSSLPLVYRGPKGLSCGTENVSTAGASLGRANTVAAMYTDARHVRMTLGYEDNVGERRLVRSD